MDPLENQFKFINNQSSTEVYYKNIICSLRETKIIAFRLLQKKKYIHTEGASKDFLRPYVCHRRLCVGIQ